jgi:hypothetical protein
MAKAIPLADLEGKSLDSKIKAYFLSREKSGRQGLQLLDVCIQRTASQSRDWDGLARFLSASARTGQVDKVRKIIRAAFGDKLKWVASAKHPAGGKFIIGWDGSFGLLNSPTYALITKAIEQGMGWDDKAFNKILSDAMPTVKKARDGKSPEQVAKVVKHLATYTEKLKADGFDVGEVIAALQKELASKVVSKPVAQVERQVVNGITIYEPNF